jgi:hypothetical protein
MMTYLQMKIATTRTRIATKIAPHHPPRPRMILLRAAGLAMIGLRITGLLRIIEAS